MYLGAVAMQGVSILVIAMHGRIESHASGNSELLLLVSLALQVAVVACLVIYWQARAIERRTRVLPDDLSLQLEDVGVGVGDQGHLARP